MASRSCIRFEEMHFMISVFVQKLFRVYYHSAIDFICQKSALYISFSLFLKNFQLSIVSPYIIIFKAIWKLKNFSQKRNSVAALDTAVNMILEAATQHASHISHVDHYPKCCGYSLDLAIQHAEKRNMAAEKLLAAKQMLRRFRERWRKT